MLDHVTIGVSGLERSKAFYDEALKSIGIERLYAEGDSFAGYGANKKAFFWIGLKISKRRGVNAAIFVDVFCETGGHSYAARDTISGCFDAAQFQGSSVCSS